MMMTDTINKKKQVMRDTIYRENAIKALLRMDGIKIDKALAIGEIRSVPSADRPQKVVAQITFDEEKLREIVKETVERFKEEYEITDRPSGEWIDCGSYYKCPFCEEIEFESDGQTNFCPNCGARMREINNE